jgi:hypothetical protein
MTSPLSLLCDADAELGTLKANRSVSVIRIFCIIGPSFFSLLKNEYSLEQGPVREEGEAEGVILDMASSLDQVATFIL